MLAWTSIHSLAPARDFLAGVRPVPRHTGSARYVRVRRPPDLTGYPARSWANPKFLSILTQVLSRTH